MLRLGEGCALALAGVQYDAAGDTLVGIGVLDGVVDGLHIVTVDLLGIQAEGRGLLGDVAVGQDVVGRAVQMCIRDRANSLSMLKASAPPA